MHIASHRVDSNTKLSSISDNSNKCFFLIPNDKYLIPLPPRVSSFHLLNKLPYPSQFWWSVFCCFFLLYSYRKDVYTEFMSDSQIKKECMNDNMLVTIITLQSSLPVEENYWRHSIVKSLLTSKAELLLFCCS